MDIRDFHPPIFPRDNKALYTNPPLGTNHITTHGSNWLWAAMAFFGLLFLCVLGLLFVQRHEHRVFHYIALAILFVMTLEYFTMASDLGSIPIPQQFKHKQPGLLRQIFWVRFIEWFIVWSLEVLALMLLSCVGWSTIWFTVGLTMAQAVMYLAGALTFTSYKWGYFAFALFLYFLIAYQLFVAARAWATRFDVGGTYSGLAAFLLTFWLFYPISWGLSEGGNVISNDGEQIFYGVLDIISKGFFALALVFLARSFDYKRLGLEMTDYGRVHDDGYGAGGITGGEKVRGAGGTVPTATNTAAV